MSSAYTFSFYRLTDGRFTGEKVTCLQHRVQQAVPPACGFLLGDFDHRTQRVDPDTGAVLSIDTSEAVQAEERQAHRRSIVDEIEATELKLVRPMRELLQAQLAGEEASAETLEHWQAANERIAELQLALREIDADTQ
jgi:hypothetical protein